MAKRGLNSQEISEFLDIEISPEKKRKIRNEEDKKKETPVKQISEFLDVEISPHKQMKKNRNEKERKEESSVDDDTDEDPNYSPPLKVQKKQGMKTPSTKNKVDQRKRRVTLEYESSDEDDYDGEDDSEIEFEGFDDEDDLYADVELRRALDNMEIEEDIEEEIEDEETLTSISPDPYNWEDYSSSRQQNFTFDEDCGLTDPVREKTEITVKDAFFLFITDDLLNMIVEQTNIYGDARSQSNELKANSILKKWKHTTVEELQKFLGLVLWMGLVRLGKIQAYWSTNPIYHITLPSKTMSRNRFELMLQCLHFADNSVDTQNNRLAKIEPIITKLQQSFHSILLPGEDVVIDETLVPWRGRLVFRQYIPNKAHKYGIKLFKLCTKTGYTYSFQVYTGKSETGEREVNLAQNICLKLMEGLLNKGRTLYVDNFYTTHSLAVEFLKKKTHVVGTVRANRKIFPKEVMSAKLKKGEMVSKQDINGVVILKWKDKRDVYLMSTKHEPSFATVEEQRLDDPNDTILEDPDQAGPSTRRKKAKSKKPIGIIAYNKGKAGIDLSDQLSSYATALRKGVKWYRKLAMELLLGICVVNAKVVYETINKKKIKIREFREELATHLPGLDKEIEKTPNEGSHRIVKGESRKHCKSCYKKISNEQGRDMAKKRAPRVTTNCNICEEAMCYECFFSLHSSKRI